MRIFSWCLLLVLLGTTGLHAETVYVEFNPGCMDRMEYLDNVNGTETHSFAYHLKSGDQRIVFNTGADRGSRVAQAPGNLLNCQSTFFNDDFLKTAKQQNIYLVQRNGSGYDLIPVRSVSRVRGSDGVVDYYSASSRFTHDYKLKKAGDWSTTESPNKVFHEGTKLRYCYRASTFRSIPEDDVAAPFTEMVVIPEIGVIQSKTGLTPEDAKKNTRNLVKVNNTPFGQYLRAVCAGEDPKAYTNGDLMAMRGPGSTATTARVAEPTPPAEPTPEPVAAPVPEEQATTTVRTSVSFSETAVAGTTTTKTVTTPVNADCDVPNAPGVHVVRRGETLYAITRRYGITVDQIKRWNQLGNNTIKPCMPLNVVDPASLMNGTETTVTTTTTVPATTTTPTTTTTVTTAPTASVPVPTTTPKQPEVGQVIPRWADTNGTHVVQAGEGVAALAEKYGYTEARFRWMNGLDANDGIVSGQVLRTKECDVPALSPERRAMPFSTTTAAPTTTTPTSETDLQPKGATDLMPKSARRVHMVKKDETLYSISRKYGMELSDLLRLNDLKKGEVILEGMTIYLN